MMAATSGSFGSGYNFNHSAMSKTRLKTGSRNHLQLSQIKEAINKPYKLRYGADSERFPNYDNRSDDNSKEALNDYAFNTNSVDSLEHIPRVDQSTLSDTTITILPTNRITKKQSEQKMRQSEMPVLTSIYNFQRKLQAKSMSPLHPSGTKSIRAEDKISKRAKFNAIQKSIAKNIARDVSTVILNDSNSSPTIPPKHSHRR